MRDSGGDGGFVMRRLLWVWMGCLVAGSAFGQVMISGNEGKIGLTTGTPQVLSSIVPDSLSVLDFSSFPPKVTHLDDVSNSVVGPPSNIAITPDEKLALVASSIKIDPNDKTKYVPDHVIRLIDLESEPPKVCGEVATEAQPSGMSISLDGRFAIVANRGAGSVSLLTIDGKQVAVKQTLVIAKPEDNVADVAIAPDGSFALVSVSTVGGYLARVEIANGKMSLSERKYSVYGKPYRCIITPDGAYALTAGSGQGAPDTDAMTVIDLKARVPKTVDYLPLATDPESIEISPDGKLVVAVLIDGSNKPKDDVYHTSYGQIILFARHGGGFDEVQRLATGPIPEGVAFSADGKYVVVQCHPIRELWVYEVRDGKLVDTTVRIGVPGMPSGVRSRSY